MCDVCCVIGMDLTQKCELSVCFVHIKHQPSTLNTAIQYNAHSPLLTVPGVVGQNAGRGHLEAVGHVHVFPESLLVREALGCVDVSAQHLRVKFSTVFTLR